LLWFPSCVASQGEGQDNRAGATFTAALDCRDYYGATKGFVVQFCGPGHFTAEFLSWAHLFSAPVECSKQASIHAKLSAGIHTKMSTFDDMKTRGADNSVWKK
jgi:hypothetical protein